MDNLIHTFNWNEENKYVFSTQTRIFTRKTANHTLLTTITCLAINLIFINSNAIVYYLGLPNHLFQGVSHLVEAAKNAPTEDEVEWNEKAAHETHTFIDRNDLEIEEQPLKI